MNVRMWIKALRIIPRISKAEWDTLDGISRWLIATRAAVLIITFIPAAIAGLLAARAGMFDWGRWALVTVGLLFAHATNNMLNDITDYRKGVDKDNYYRTQYGPQPLESGLMTEKQVYRYVAFNAIVAVLCGALLVAQTGWITLAFMAAGAFFVLFYTWPLKYIGLGEIAVILVWGPLMVGGGYYAITGVWDANIWNVMIASLPYALGATTVIFGKHIDKLAEDKAKNIHTLPVLIGETAGRYVVIGMMVAQYVSTIYLVITGYFSLWMLAVIPAVWGLKKVLPIFLKPRPKERPADYGEDIWPLWYVAAGFYHNRMFGMLYLVGLILQLVIR